MTYKQRPTISWRQISRPNYSRRAFLKLSGLAMLSTVAAGCSLRRRSAPTPTPLGTPDVEIALTAQEVQWELAPGKLITAWTYNGKVPGEGIRVRESDRVRVILTNNLPESTTIHWHGVDVPANMDGVPDVSQPAIRPAETFIYEFEARPAGTRWYHTHFNSAKQMDLGLSGPFIIEPLTPDAPTDREYTLALDDWVTGVVTPSAPPTDNGMMGGDSSSDGGMMDGMTPALASGASVGSTGPAYDTFTINGKAFPATDSLKVEQGERIRLRLINASNMQTFVIRLAGHRLQVTHTDGNPLQTPIEVDAVPIAPAERYDVTFLADNPGKWPLYALDPAHTAGGLKTLVIYEDYESTPDAELKYSSGGLTLWSYGLGKGIDLLPAASGRPGAFDLTLSGGMTPAPASGAGVDPNVWTINGQVYPNTETLKANLNQLVQVRLFNMSMQAHPMHLHGQSFRVLSLGGQALSTPLIKDTVDVPAMTPALVPRSRPGPGARDGVREKPRDAGSGTTSASAGRLAPAGRRVSRPERGASVGTADIEFVAFNPGNWMFHCHKPMHMDGGMAALVKIG